MNSLFETIIIGLNCGYDEVFPGGYDWFPCQHERYQQRGDGKWINKISYCAGSDDKCLSKGITDLLTVLYRFEFQVSD